MAFVTPKIDWSTSDGIMNTDLNRIEGNTLDNHNVSVGNALDISNNLSSIQNNDTDIANNLSSIQSNDTDIDSNLSRIQSIETELSRRYYAYGGFTYANQPILLTGSSWSLISKTGYDLWNVNGVGVSHDNDHLVISNSGLYMGVLSITFSNLTAGRILIVRAYNVTQSVTEGQWIRSHLPVAGSMYNMCLPLQIYAGDGDYIAFELSSTAGLSVTAVDASFNFHRVRT